jgi:hypothetical protein
MKFTCSFFEEQKNQGLDNYVLSYKDAQSRQNNYCWGIKLKILPLPSCFIFRVGLMLQGVVNRSTGIMDADWH